jgi:hypothetical protein
MDDPRNNEGEPLNQYGEVATHQDCIHNPGGGCEGWMCWWENPRSYNRMLMCAHHAERADQQQAEIFRNYYFDAAEDY